MKQFLSFLLAAIAGGLIALGSVSLLNKDTAISANISTTDFSAQQINLINKKPVKGAAIFDFTVAAKLANPVVVYISAQAGEKTSKNNLGDDPMRFFFGDDTPVSGSGSGVIYSSDGYIVTNNHVIEFADKIEVTLFDNRKFSAKVVGTNKKTDLAILKIEANDLPTLAYSDSDKAEVGEWTLAVGNPFDLTSTVTAGIISAKGRSLGLLRDYRDAIESFIQTDAAVNPGNSGGALIDASGRLLGINTAIASQTGVFQGYSFAIPINLVKRIADDIIQYGTYKRAFLGVNIYPLDSKAAADLGLHINQGVVIEKVEKKGSAQLAGLRAKDVITKVENKIIKTVPDLAEVIGLSKAGDVLDITINRHGKTLSIPVQMLAETSN